MPARSPAIQRVLRNATPLLIFSAAMLAASMLPGAGARLLAVETSAWEIGGPLAGLKLPLFPTRHGERPGQPGALPGKYDDDLVAPQVELLPGSVENFRAYWFKYLPVRSAFDRQSLLRRWVAPEIPGVLPSQIEQLATPLYYVPRHKPPVDTGLKNPPVAVVRCKVGSPVIRLDLGELDEGLFAIRLIGAVPTEQLRAFRRPLFLRATIDDGPQGEKSTHRLRLGYVDEFYSIAEVYFHATGRRAFHAELAIDRGSEVDLLLESVTLDDALAGHQRRAIKTRTTIFTHPLVPESTSKQKPLGPAERLARDTALWQNYPPINRQAGNLGTGGDEHTLRKNVSRGAGGKTAEEIEAQHGRWERPGALTAANDGDFLVNKKLGLHYTLDDLRAGRPLPDPYPWKDDGAGLYWADPQDPGKGMVWCQIADEVGARIRDYPSLVNASVKRWRDTGDPDAGRDAAIAMARFAYDFPALDAGNLLLCVVRDPGPYGREYRCRRREMTAIYLSHYMIYVDPLLYDYDRLFDFLKDNQEVAQSIGRFIPWVKTPRDVVRLLDTYLVQTVAKRILRYQYHTTATDIAGAAAVLGDRQVTDPWLQWLFSRTFIYPLPACGIQDAMITASERDGCQHIGSTFYAQGEGASVTAAALEQYLRAGGNPQFNLADRQRYPKPVAHLHWRLRNVVAGWDFLRVGDVTGPDKTPGHTLRDLEFARTGWRWTADPWFAFVVKNYLPRADESDAEWAAIEQAAARQRRAPWLDNASRMMPMWAGVLESGLEHDDPRFRRAAYVRVGLGTGHHHADTMDLQVVAHGQPATIDGGQRNGYSSPSDHATRVHNVVEVDAKGFHGHSWVRALADTPGARYVHAQAEPPAGTTLFARQVALVDVDEGQNSSPLPIEAQKPLAKLPAGVTPANGYVFDVFRVAGGRLHTYCFHGPMDDDFSWNVAAAAPVTDAQSEAGKYLTMFRSFPEKKRAGPAPETLQATWRQTRKGTGAESNMLGPNFAESLPRRFTRLHLLDAAGAQAMIAQHDCITFKYQYTCLMVQKAGTDDNRQSAFAAIIEPYVGEPIIRDVRALAVEGSGADARRPVAVEVKTSNGHTDVCFADGQPGAVRRVAGPGLRVAAEFAFYGADREGLRVANFSGGTLLEAADVRLTAATAQRSGKVVKADYLAKTAWIDQPWPARQHRGVLEIGKPGHTTAYTALRVAPAEQRACLTLENGADFFRAVVTDVKPAEATVTCAMNPALGLCPGLDRHWVASNDDMTVFWRADLIGDKVFKLHGPAVTRESFGAAGVLRLWEYGVGDEVRQSTFAGLRRVKPGLYQLAADTDVTLALPGRGLEISPNGTDWTPLATRPAGKMVEAAIPLEKLSSEGRAYVRVP